MQRRCAEVRLVDRIDEPTFRPRWYPGFPERLMAATPTCAPWTWVLVAPCDQAPKGFANVQTGEAPKAVWREAAAREIRHEGLEPARGVSRASQRRFSTVASRLHGPGPAKTK